MKKTVISVAVTMISCLLVSCKDNQAPTEAPLIKVTTLTVQPTSTDGTQAFSGTVEEESGSTLSFATAGTLKRVCVAEGQMIGQGTLIAEVDEQSARNAYEATLAARERAEDALNRMKLMHDAGSLSDFKWVEVQSQVKQAISSEQIAKKGLKDCKLYAPFAGYVAAKPVEVGQNVIPGMTVVKLVRIDRIKVKLSVPEEEISAIKLGQSVSVTVAALGGRSFTGRIVERGVEANAVSRTYDVKVLIANADHALLPGMVCNAQLTLSGSQGAATAIMLPASVVQIDVDNRTFVWTMAGGKAHKTFVSTGQNVGNDVVITSGLALNDKVIVKGQQKVSEGTKVSELTSK